MSATYREVLSDNGGAAFGVGWASTPGHTLRIATRGLPVPVLHERVSDEHGASSPMLVLHGHVSDEHGAYSPVLVCRMRAPDGHRTPSPVLIGHIHES